MRVYVGDHSDGNPRVVVVERQSGPEPAEIARLLTELRQLNRAVPSDTVDHRRQERTLIARKQSLLARIAASEPARTPQPLSDWSPIFSEPWGDKGPGSLDLADCILCDAFREAPSRALAVRFRDEVVARFPREGFRLSDAEVAAWHAATVEQSPPATMPAPAALAQDVATSAGAATASELVSACESAWAAIQAAHPGVPDAVIVLGTGVERGKLVKLGHWWDGRWLADGTVRGEVLLAGEALHLPATDVFEVLLHEAAHGLNAARGIRDASRGGRYHNQQFRTTAAALGLRVEKMPPHGWAGTTLTLTAADQYAEPIAALAQAMRISRQLDAATLPGPGQEHEQETSGAPGTVGRTRNGVGATCGCGRRLRIAPSVLAQGAVLCGVCGAEFTTERSLARSMERRGLAIVDESFMERRRRALSDAAELAQDVTGPTAPPTGDERPTGLRERSVTAGLDGTGDAIQGILRAGMLESWREVWGTDAEVLLAGGTDAEIHQLNHLARRALKRDGTLHGPALTIGGHEFMTGDRVVAGPAGVGWPGGGPPVPEGIVGTVEALGRDWIDIDFAIVGRGRFPAATLGPRSLTHGYAVNEADVAGEVDLRSLRIPLPHNGLTISDTAEVACGAEMEP